MRVIRLILFLTLLLGTPATFAAESLPKRCLSYASLVGSEASERVRRAVDSVKKLFQKPGGKGSNEYPKPSRHYRAHDKDTDQPQDKSVPPRVAFSVAIPNLELVRQTVYTSIDSTSGRYSHRSGVRALGGSPLVPELSGTAHLGEAKGWQYLFVPGEMQPVGIARGNGRLGTDADGNYYVQGTGEVQIAYARSVRRALAADERARLTYVRPVPTGRWPGWLQENIARLKKERAQHKLTNTEVARELQRAILENMEYRVDKSDIKDLVEAANSGKVQCDRAAGIWTTVLRGEFGIPTRIEAGYRGKLRKGNAEETFVALPGEGHAWGSVFEDRDLRWQEVDPTPTKLDREKVNKPSPDDEFTDVAQQFEPQPAEARDEKDQEKKPQEKLEADDENEGEKKDSHAAEGKSEEGEKDRAVMSDALTEPFLEAAYRELLEAALESSATFHARAKALAAWLGRMPAATNPAVRRLADRLVDLLREAPAVDSYRSLAHLAEELPAGGRPPAKLTFLARALREIERLRPLTRAEGDLLLAIDPKAAAANGTQARVIFQEMLDGATGMLSRRMLLARYLDGHGELDVKTFTDDLNAGKLTTMREMHAAREYLDLALQANLTRTKKVVYDKLGPTRQETTRVLMPLEEYDPGKVFRDGMPMEWDLVRHAAGDLYSYSYPQPRIKTNAPKKQARVVYVLVDMSGSMEWNERYRARNAVMAGLVDRVFSEENQSMFLVPYTGSISRFEGIDEKTAPAKLAELLASPWSWGGSNDTAAAMDGSFDHAQGVLNTRENVGAVDFILLTDGNETIDVPRLTAARDVLAKRAQVGIRAVTLVDGNRNIDELVDHSLAGSGGGKGRYHLTVPDITRVVTQGKVEKLNGGETGDRVRFNYPAIADALRASAPDHGKGYEAVTALRTSVAARAGRAVGPGVGLNLQPLLAARELAPNERAKIASDALVRIARDAGVSVESFLDRLSPTEIKELAKCLL